MTEVVIVEVRAQTAAYDQLFALAGRLGQAKYIPVHEQHIQESILFGAFTENQCVAFLRFVIQIIRSDQGRTPIEDNGFRLIEGYVEAFGVAPEYRRHGIGQSMQEHAMALCKAKGCYQIRSRSPVTSHENYALKLKMGYAIHPSNENDSYYFIKTLNS